MSPSLLLILLLLTTLAALSIEGIRRGRQQERVRALASRWRMNFGRVDTLRLTHRVARHFPIPGAAALRVYNVVYGIEGDVHRYIFTAEYTLGIAGAKRRQTRVGTFVQPRDRGQCDDPTVILASSELSLLAQYRVLADREVDPAVALAAE